MDPDPVGSASLSSIQRPLSGSVSIQTKCNAKKMIFPSRFQNTVQNIEKVDLIWPDSTFNCGYMDPSKWHRPFCLSPVLPGGRGHPQITQNRPYQKIICGEKLVNWWRWKWPWVAIRWCDTNLGKFRKFVCLFQKWRTEIKKWQNPSPNIMFFCCFLLLLCFEMSCSSKFFHR